MNLKYTSSQQAFWCQQNRKHGLCFYSEQPSKRRSKIALKIISHLDALELLSLHLQRTGYKTMTANDGESGVLVAHKEKPDLILLDFVLPEMDGYQVLESRSF